jgi:glycosyltransferase involved in cell wall biosynthesis
MIAPISWRVPPRHYGPWEQFVSLLTEGLVERGIDVTLFATADSITGARLVGSAPTGYSEDGTLDAKVWESLHISAVFERAAEFDLIHNSFDFLPLCYSALVDTPIVTTIHGFSSQRIVPVYQKYDRHSHYVAISESDRHPSLDYIATIHHGIDMGEFEVGSRARDYLLFFGRIHPDKGTAEAIEVARRAERPLLIAGIVQDQEYFERAVKPHIDGDRVRFLGAVDRSQRAGVLGGARALLHLIDFEEPPVIAYRRGSMAELIVDGQNGYLVASPAEAVAAVRAAGDADHQRIRASVEQRFDVSRMVDQYVSVYRRIVADRARRGARSP